MGPGRSRGRYERQGRESYLIAQVEMGADAELLMNVTRAMPEYSREEGRIGT